MGRLAVLLLVAILSGCRGDDFRDANVVVIGIDTLRADHVGAYGYPRPTTPRIDAFARGAVRFETAVSQSSWTVPGFASMFTGLVPSEHRAGEGMCPDVTSLDDRHETLAGALRAGGYRTASFVSNVWVSSELGLARGFDEHERVMFSSDAVERALGWLRERRRSPFFLFVHVMDPHKPYAPSAEDARPFVDPAYHGPIGASFSGGVVPGWNDADRRRIVDLYDGEVRFADGLVGRVLDTLDELGLTERTIVVVVSDHGEELFDHAGIGHGHTLFDELLLVPFLIRFPGAWAHGAVARPVRTMDLFPTLLDAVGRPVPAGLNGVSLMPLLRGAADAPPTEVALSESPCFAADVGLQSLRTAHEKLVFSPVSAHAQLFDLTTDPHEQTDLAAERPADVAALRDRLAEEASRVRDGFHLIVRGAGEGSEVRLRLEAAAGFHDVALLSGEPSDHVRVTRKGTVLEAALRSTGSRAGIRGDDVDVVAFRTGNDEPFVVRRVLYDRVPLARADVTIGNGATMYQRMVVPLRLDANLGGMLVVRPVPAPPRLDHKPRLQVAFVRPATAPKAAVTPEMAERLRAMGYVR